MFDVTMGSQGCRRNVRVKRNLHDVLDSIQILKWSWPVLWRWSRNLQSESERNWKIIVNLNLNLKLEREKTKEEVSQVFKSNGLKITIDANRVINSDANKKIATFLMWPWTSQKVATSHIWSLTTNCHISINKATNPSTTKPNIPLNNNRRLTNISSSKEVFDKSIAPNQKPLLSGYSHKLTCNPTLEQAPKNKRKRQRNITWYNPPFDSNVKTILGRKFLSTHHRQMLTKKPSTPQDYNRHT